MIRTRSSLDKPPLAVSPRRLRPRRTLRSDAAAAATAATKIPAPSPKGAVRLRRSCAPEESPLVSQYERISHELQDLAQKANEDITSGHAADSFASVAKLAAGPRSPFLERGRLYDVYSARRNERLKRKMEETFEALPPRLSAAEADLGKRKSAKRAESLRMSLPDDFHAGPASRLRSSGTTIRRSNGSSSVLRSSMKLKIDGEKPSYLQSARRK